MGYSPSTRDMERVEAPCARVLAEEGRKGDLDWTGRIDPIRLVGWFASFFFFSSFSSHSRSRSRAVGLIRSLAPLFDALPSPIHRYEKQKEKNRWRRGSKQAGRMHAREQSFLRLLFFFSWIG